jgi:multiple sugar transport system ATP-binding protein
MVFQNYALYPNKTVGENMDFPLKMRGLSKAERVEKVRAAADVLGLTEFLDRKPRALSGGQRQRVAMGRAIVREPQVFLMDEPLSNLDAKMRVGTRAEIAALQQRLGVTTIYVTHDQVEAMTMGNRVAVLKLGELQQFATPAELYDVPRNAFVAGFIGSPAMNLYTVPVEEEGARLGGQNGSDQGIAAEITVVEELGSDAFIYGKLVTDPSESIVVRGSGRSGARIGDKISLHTTSDELHLFHPDTGERL